MVEAFSLSWDDERVAIFTQEARSNILERDAGTTNTLLSSIINCLENSKPQSVIEKGYETCQELEQLRQGDWRIYCKYVDDLPEYAVLWVFAVRKHRYRNLGNFDMEACKRVEQLANLTSVGQVEGYIERNEAWTVDELKEARG